MNIREEDMTACTMFCAPHLLVFGEYGGVGVGTQYGATWTHPRYPTLLFSYVSYHRVAFIMFVHPSLLESDVYKNRLRNRYPTWFEDTEDNAYAAVKRGNVESSALFDTFGQLMLEFRPEVFNIITGMSDA